MTDFVISENKLLAIEMILKQSGIPIKRNVLLSEIRSRLLSDELKAERERVIDAVKHLIEYNDDLFGFVGNRVLSQKVIAYEFLLSDEGIESLRSEQP